MQRPIVLALLSGALYALAFYLPYGWPLIFVALVPLLYAIQKCKTVKQAFLTSLITGAVLVGATTFWMFAARPLPTAFSLSPFVNFASVFVSWFLIMLFTAPLVGVWGIVAKRLLSLRVLGVLGTAIAWVFVVEYLRMYMFALVTYTPTVSNPLFWTTGALGYPLADSLSWVQFASFGGIWMLSFVAISMNLLVYLALSRFPTPKKWYLCAGLLFIVASVSMLPLVFWRDSLSERESVPIGFMSLWSTTDNQVAALDDVHAQALVALHSLAEEGGKILLLPEGEDFLEIRKEEISFTTPDVVVIATGLTRNSDGQKLLRGYVSNLADGRTESLRTKMVLTPQGEFLIGIFRYGMPLIGLGHAVDRFEDTKALGVGSWGNPYIGDLRASIMFCFEIFAPHFGQQLVAHHDSDIIFTTIAHARFYTAPHLDQDTFRMMRVRGVEAGVPLIVSANHTPAYAFDAHGRVIRSLGRQGVSEWGVVVMPL